MKTIDLKGKQYAEVKERVKQFRSENARGLIETIPTFLENGRVLYKARVLKDKAEPTSAESSGHALGDAKGEKDFEKLETIAVGRALALLGYGADGAIASSEEMEEFEEYQETKRSEAVLTWTEKLGDAKSLEELAKAWVEVPAEIKPEVLEYKNDLKKRFAEPVTEAPTKKAKSKSEIRRLAQQEGKDPIEAVKQFEHGGN